MIAKLAHDVRCSHISALFFADRAHLDLHTASPTVRKSFMIGNSPPPKCLTLGICNLPQSNINTASHTSEFGLQQKVQGHATHAHTNAISSLSRASRRRTVGGDDGGDGDGEGTSGEGGGEGSGEGGGEGGGGERGGARRRQRGDDDGPAPAWQRTAAAAARADRRRIGRAVATMAARAGTARHAIETRNGEHACEGGEGRRKRWHLNGPSSTKKM